MSVGRLEVPACESQVVPFIGCPAGSLRLPQGLAERLHERMFGAVQVAVPSLQKAVQLTHSGRPVDGHLVAYREMQPHV